MNRARLNPTTASRMCAPPGTNRSRMCVDTTAQIASARSTTVVSTRARRRRSLLRQAIQFSDRHEMPVRWKPAESLLETDGTFDVARANRRPTTRTSRPEAPRHARTRPPEPPRRSRGARRRPRWSRTTHDGVVVDLARHRPRHRPFDHHQCARRKLEVSRTIAATCAGSASDTTIVNRSSVPPTAVSTSSPRHRRNHDSTASRSMRTPNGLTNLDFLPTIS